MFIMMNYIITNTDKSFVSIEKLIQDKKIYVPTNDKDWKIFAEENKLNDICLAIKNNENDKAKYVAYIKKQIIELQKKLSAGKSDIIGKKLFNVIK
jgi:hypothetical protein